MKKQLITGLELYATVLSKIVGVSFMIGAVLTLPATALVLVKGQGDDKLLLAIIMLGAAVLGGGVGFVVFKYFPSLLHNRMHALFEAEGIEPRT